MPSKQQLVPVCFNDACTLAPEPVAIAVWCIGLSVLALEAIDWYKSRKKRRKKRR